MRILLSADLSSGDLSLIRATTSTNLSGAYLIGANLSGAKMNAADPHGANLIDADLSGASLNDANLRGANLRGAEGLTQEQLNQACGTNAGVDSPLRFNDKPCPK
jgi:uncharacterized protein YjbI with pentapeptide repeats